jgi:hypothetical protein
MIVGISAVRACYILPDFVDVLSSCPKPKTFSEVVLVVDKDSVQQSPAQREKPPPSKRRYACNSAPKDEGVNVVCSLVSVDRLKINHVSHDLKIT